MALISCNNITLGYDGQAVSEGITFSVGKGDYLCIVGENGAGKSTLMKTLLHLIEPVQGKIEYGEGIGPWDAGYLPQQSMVQKDFPASVYEVVLSGNLTGKKKGFFYTREEHKKAQDNMKLMDILDLKNKCYRELSGGQQQRVLLARALCAANSMLILDEPVNGLDPKATAQMYHEISNLNKSGLTIIMVTHDMMAAVSYASHILHIGRKQEFFGETEKYLESCAFKKIGGLGGNVCE